MKGVLISPLPRSQPRRKAVLCEHRADLVESRTVAHQGSRQSRHDSLLPRPALAPLGAAALVTETKPRASVLRGPLNRSTESGSPHAAHRRAQIEGEGGRGVTDRPVRQPDSEGSRTDREPQERVEHDWLSVESSVDVGNRRHLECLGRPCRKSGEALGVSGRRCGEQRAECLVVIDLEREHAEPSGVESRSSRGSPPIGVVGDLNEVRAPHGARHMDR